MYRWKIVYHLRDGRTLTGMYKSDATSSTDVLKELIEAGDNSFTPVHVANGVTYFEDGILAVRLGDIAAVELYVWKGRGE